MKRSTFRKSSLISSVALLLVAIVALSGATFAWFAQGKTTKVDGIDMTAVSASGLYIMKSKATTCPAADDEGWGGSVTLSSLNEANPTSANFTSLTNVTFLTTSTDQTDGKYNGADITDAAASDYVAEQVWVRGDKVVGDDNVTEVAKTLKLTVAIDGNTKGYERIAVVDLSAQTPVIVGGICSENGGQKYKPLISKAGAEGTEVTTVAATEFEVTTSFKPSEGRHFAIYCWFEGQDATCFNDNSGAQFDGTISFSLAD